MDFKKLAEAVKRIHSQSDDIGKLLAEKWDAREKTMDDACASGYHQGALSNPIFSGADSWWECSRCKRRVLQVGDNRPMSI